MHLLTVFIGLLCGFLCSRSALKVGRNQVCWFLLGFSFGVCALLLLYLLPPIKKREKGAPLSTPSGPEKLNEKPEKSRLLPFETVLWYYLDNEKKQHGPMSFHLLRRSWEEGKISRKSYIWNEGMENWERVEERKELLSTLEGEESPSET